MAAAVWLGGSRFVKELEATALMQQAVSGDTVLVTGQVYAREIKSDYQVLYLKHNSIKFRKQQLKESKFIVYVKSSQEVKIGNKITAEGTVRFYEEPRNPGNFNEKRYYEKQGIHACMWSESVIVTSGSVWKVRESLFSFRQKWKAVLYDYMGEEQGTMLCGIMLGDKADIDPAVKELYQMNGIGHILAISGLHLSIIGIGMYRLCRRLCGSYAAGGICGMLFLFAYILMTGISVSAVRATVMFLFRIGADMAGRRYDTGTALAAAACIVLLFRPLYLYDGGFWLSFGAVFGVAAVLPLFRKLPVQGLWASVSINLSILPILLYYFYEYPLYSILLNLFVIPLMPVLLLLGLAGSAAALALPWPGEAALSLCRVLLTFYEWLCRTAARLPAARIITGRPSVVSVICYYILLFTLLLMWGRYKSRRNADTRKKYIAKYIIISGVTYAAALFILIPRTSGREGQLEVTMLDVGQGDGIYMKAPSGRTYLFDGGSSDVRQAGKYRIEPFLKYKGTGRIDYAFISHGDSDHMNAIREMIERGPLGIPIGHLVLPREEVWDDSLTELAALARDSGIKVFVMEEGQRIQDGSLSLYCLHPGGTYRGEPGNAASMAVWVRYGRFDMLLTGDVEGEGEAALTAAVDEAKEEWQRDGFDGILEVLKVAHHGSKNSTSARFLEVTKPVYGLVSAGRDNRYGHPHRDTAKRLEDIGCRLYITPSDGAVTVWTDGSRMSISACAGGAGS